MRNADILINNGINVNKALELFGTMDKYDATLEVFYDTINEKLTQLRTFKETSDMAQYATLVHALKSEARYFGMDQFGELAYQHELGAKANNMYYVHDNFNILMTEIDRVVKVVGQYLNREIKIAATEVELPAVRDKTILVVDDSNIVMHFVRQIFDNQFEILSAKDGNEAITMIESRPEGKIIGMLLDLHMPNANGFTVLNYMKQKNLFDSIPVCIITGIDTREVDQQAFAYPIVDMVKKPFNERDIKSKVDTFISIHNNRQIAAAAANQSSSMPASSVPVAPQVIAPPEPPMEVPVVSPPPVSTVQPAVVTPPTDNSSAA